MQTTDLAGKAALVTGAGTRVGAAIAVALGAQRMHVVVHYHGSGLGAQRTCEAVRAAGGDAVAMRADLFDAAEIDRLADAASAHFGRLDLVVASAANFERVPLAQIERSHFDSALNLNLLAPFLLAQRTRSALQAVRGSVVFITCNSRIRPYRDYLPYEVSKAALYQLMRVLALELAPDVRVNAVAPGTVLPPVGLSPTQVDALLADIPLGKVGGAASVAEAVVYLAGAEFATGTEILVDGGRALT